MEVHQFQGGATAAPSPASHDHRLQAVKPLMTFEQFLAIVFYVFGATILISFFGVLSNIANILIFYKMGFSSPSNISLFCLALVDLLILCYILIVSFGNHPLFVGADLPFSLPDAARTGALVYYGCSAISSWITAIITVERSCCVAYPMKVNRIFTRKTIIGLIGIMVIYQIASGLPRSFGVRFTWTVSPQTNRTLVTFVIFRPRLVVASYLASFSVPSLLCFAVVLVGTVFMIAKLKLSRQLRNSMTGSGNDTNILSDKDIRLVRSMVFICIIFIVGSAPGILMNIAGIAYPPLHADNPYLRHFYVTFFAISMMFLAIHSSVNIFVYLTMGTNFKKTFKEMFFFRSY
ncbi:hypothetical protein RRG08_048684 [Elysia crispata]|uniref:G-protein coupled receptors family 1 profile domain-containing protein n=1 Tax=Elysia crispata TaxID=231223 RepID=A0AAE1A9Q5_9GAST|nr:hypothetical protein RRG08_048684 [Elysia crispata]